MALSSRPYLRSTGYADRLPKGIKYLLIVNVGIFLLQYLSRGRLDEFFSYFALYPAAVVRMGFIWQVATYMFLHGNLWHILWNMLALWMFGRELEQMWGMRRFLEFYFFCGVGAGIVVVIANYLFGNPAIPTVGSSGAIYGLLLASAVLWPDRQILFYFFFPVKMKYFVMIIGAIAFLGSLNMNSGVSDVAHLSGMAFGYLFLKMPRRRRGYDPLVGIKDRYRQWKIERAKRKFQVYLNKQRSNRDVN